MIDLYWSVRFVFIICVNMSLFFSEKAWEFFNFWREIIDILWFWQQSSGLMYALTLSIVFLDQMHASVNLAKLELSFWRTGTWQHARTSVEFCYVVHATLLGYIVHASSLACPCGSWKLELACLPLHAEQTSRPSWKLLYLISSMHWSIIM